MGRKKGQGAGRNGRDSNPKSLGIKRFSGQMVKSGTIIVRQRGSAYRPGLNVEIGKDDTLFAKATGKVLFKTIRKDRKVISVIPVSS